MELAPEAPPAVEFRSFAPVRFETVTVGGLEEADTLDKLLARIETAWEEARRADPGEEGTEWVVRFGVTGGSPSWKRLDDEEERVTLAREAAAEIGLLDAEVQAGPLHPVVPGGERQREMAFRFGINLVMYVLTGNYKSDQVHIPAIMERLGQ